MKLKLKLKREKTLIHDELWPIALAVTTDLARVFLCNGQAVTEIDLTTRTVREIDGLTEPDNFGQSEGAFAADDACALVALSDPIGRGFRLWRRARQGTIQFVDSPWLHGLALSADGTRAVGVAGEREHALYVFDTETGTLLAERAWPQRIVDVCFDRDGTIHVADASGTVLQWSDWSVAPSALARFPSVLGLRRRAHAVSALVREADCVAVVDLPDARVGAASWPGEVMEPRSLAVHPTEPLLAMGDADGFGRFEVWDLAARRRLVARDLESEIPVLTYWHPREPRLLTATHDRIALWSWTRDDARAPTPARARRARTTEPSESGSRAPSRAGASPSPATVVEQLLKEKRWEELLSLVAALRVQEPAADLVVCSNAKGVYLRDRAVAREKEIAVEGREAQAQHLTRYLALLEARALLALDRLADAFDRFAEVNAGSMPMMFGLTLQEVRQRWGASRANAVARRLSEPAFYDRPKYFTLCARYFRQAPAGSNLFDWPPFLA